MPRTQFGLTKGQRHRLHWLWRLDMCIGIVHLVAFSARRFDHGKVGGYTHSYGLVQTGIDVQYIRLWNDNVLMILAGGSDED